MFFRPVTVFSEVPQSDTTEHAAQSVPMVSTSTPGLVVPGTASTGEERDNVFLEPDTDRYAAVRIRPLALQSAGFSSDLLAKLISKQNYVAIGILFDLAPPLSVQRHCCKY